MQRSALRALWLLSLAQHACAPPLQASNDASSPDAASDVRSAPVNWSEHVAPIVFDHCVSCHREGGIAPFSLATYAQSRDRALTMALATEARRMPPTLVDNSGTCNRYDHTSADWLTDAQIATLRAWSDQGAPEGDPARAPALPAPPTGLATVDARIDMGASFLPDATKMDEIRCFVVDAPSADDRFITGFQVEPGDPRVVHHAIVFALNSANGADTVTAIDARDARAGYDCPGGPLAPAYPVVLWAPGGGATSFPAGTGLRIAGGRKLVLQVHYNMAQGAFADRTRVALSLAPSVAREGRMLSIAAANLRLPPRMTEVVGSNAITLPSNLGPLRIWAVAPHMHTLGTDMQLELTSSSRCAMDLHHWNFHWQRVFFYASPIDVDPGETLSIRCHYDTSAVNAETRWGEGTEDEMCLAYAYVTAR